MAVALERAPRAGRALGAPLQQFPARPLPLASPWTGLHSTRERAGERGGARRCLRARRGRPRAGGARGARGGRGRRERPREPPPPPGFPRMPGERRGRQLSSLALRPRRSPADLSLLLKGSWRVHTSPVATSPVSLPPCPCYPPPKGQFDSFIVSSLPISEYGPGVTGEQKPGCVGARSRQAWSPSPSQGEPTVLPEFQGGVGEEPS